MWTPKKEYCVVEHTAADDAFWNTVLPKLRRFYLGSMLPELASLLSQDNQ